ncbi:hypothetical protein [sulfur-oxidizing endosymbiont of Gigantopelta aegis]|uniref:hypothetical protein n=1 Tax=sulfur-oxidizing endosymbiont of Gigantopelta aegis TaxID=2794934 RepID=UPI0018DDF722|nr:hypothetical protein [sulfur-oxidizing endosymbiont of Gigantopelta aegis]
MFKSVSKIGGTTASRLSHYWKVILGFALVLMTLVALGLWVLSSAIQLMPLVSSTDTINAESATQAKALVKRTLDLIANAEKPVSLTATAEELNGVLALASRAIPRLKGRMNVTRFGILAALSITLPENPFGYYLNLSAQINPSQAGLDIESVSIGELSVSGETSITVLRLLLDWVMGDKQGTFFLNSVESLSLERSQMTLGINASSAMKRRVEIVRQRLKGFRDEVALFGDPKKIGHYYEYLLGLSQVYQDSEVVSLALYLSPLFEEAHRLTESGKSDVENQAAILALAIFLGSYKFNSFLGMEKTNYMRLHRPPKHHVVLAERRDLRLHFIYSTALKLMGDQGSSLAIGEFKELLDSDYKGSGFSFVDLAADRAGVRLASMAMDKNGGAWRLQRLMAAEASEAIFFPDISALPEGLTKDEFKLRYGDVNAEPYKQMVSEIDRRLDALLLYR